MCICNWCHVLQIAQGMGIEDIAVEEQVLGDEKFDLMDDFFAAKKLKKLMFYFQVNYIIQ